MSRGNEIVPVIAGLAVGIALIVLLSIFFTGRLAFYPISDMKLQERMERTPEVKALYSKYPEVTVGFNRDDKIRTISFFGSNTTSPNGEGISPQITYSMQLTIFAHLVTGEVQHMELACSISDGMHDTIQSIFLEDIERHVLTGDCHDPQLMDTWR